jgi:hypothetical protein
VTVFCVSWFFVSCVERLVVSENGAQWISAESVICVVFRSAGFIVSRVSIGSGVGISCVW